MTVDELTSIFTETSDQEIVLFDLNSGEELYKGTADDVPYQYLYCEVQSIDTLFTETKTIGMAYRRGSEWLFKAIGKGSRAENINQLADEVMSLR